MRPLRFVLLLALFVALPVLLTCFSLLHSAQASSQPLGPSFRPRQSRLRALFSFTTPSSLFPPSAVISLTNDNSTFFLARPAAFGPSLPSHGLSGQLWVGKGFGEEISLTDEDIRIHGYELGCSDVPGWDIEHKQKIENGAMNGKTASTSGSDGSKAKARSKTAMVTRTDQMADADMTEMEDIDGTDDHLHQPLPDSNPTMNTEPGKPAKAMPIRVGSATHADIESLQESADIAGKVVMLSRGGCGFLEKVKWTQRRGGIAVIVGDNQPGGQLTIMYAKGDTSNVTIPSLFTSYNAAHLLSSLVPMHNVIEDDKEGVDLRVDGNGKQIRPDSSEKSSKSDSKHNMQTKSGKGNPVTQHDSEHGWVQNVLSAVGLSDEDSSVEDSRRPPSSGNIDWVLLEDWDEQKVTVSDGTPAVQVKSTAKLVQSARSPIAQITNSARIGNDEPVIGVHDWRDTELFAPKPTAEGHAVRQNGRQGKVALQSSLTSSGKSPATTKSKARIATPGSGEYGNKKHKSGPGSKQKSERFQTANDQVLSEDNRSMLEKFRAFFYHTNGREIIHPRPKDGAASTARQHGDLKHPGHDSNGRPKMESGLWVTLTPTSASTSPFFDTLLVLVVSPLVTLTIVYGLLLLRSRIRRRRWRAPKSIVERLPVRTYHTMAVAPSTASSNASSPAQSTTTSPQIHPSSARPRPRSQTTTGVISAAPEKHHSVPRARKHKRYTGRQIECVVCLEEYVDGESKVMSLPCGHEFHAECITPWLVTRRRTCPICKGDVVRSLVRSGASAEDESLQPGEQTSDDVQERAVETVNDNASAAIPIPSRDGEMPEEDIERGELAALPLLGTTRAHTMGWRGILGASIGRLSGDTLWRSTPDDRTR